MKRKPNEVVAFLSERPIHTVIMMGLIRDNGLVSEHNRGTFYGCRNSEGRLEGVALIGHATLIETRTRGAIQEFALTAQIHNHLHMFMAEQEKAETFWNAYADDGQPMRRVCRELLFELKSSIEVPGKAEDLRLATLDDLHLIAPVHAALAEAESGINPLETDREGFLARCSRRINQNRVWVVVKDNQLVFKADIQAETSELIYLEGVYVMPDDARNRIRQTLFEHFMRRFADAHRVRSALWSTRKTKKHTLFTECAASDASVVTTRSF